MKEERPSFIAEARREQIMEAAIRTLDEIGYIKASLSQIAKRAGISTALISYHFVDKNTLMNTLLMKLVQKSTSYILERVEQQKTAHNKLEVFIDASLAYQAAHREHNIALLEIIFNARTPEDIPYYKLNDDDKEDQLLLALRQILREGQEQGEFATFHIDVMANVIQGAIGEYMLNTHIVNKVDVETYSQELIQFVKKAIGVVKHDHFTKRSRQKIDDFLS